MAYQDDVIASECVRQATKQASNSQAVHKAADLLHYQNLVLAGRKWGVKNNAMQAVINLGGAVP